jgi:hypothetical protein
VDVLASTIAKLQATVRLTQELSAGDFPHAHSRDALSQINKIFEDDLKQLAALTATTDPAVIRALASAESKKLFDLFPLLGMLLRSTDVGNAFEIHGPFLRVVRQLLGPSSKLVISSEWEFSPFTFLPPIQYGLTDTVFIGGPASEASNVLLVPLAGHELGHNVWAKQRRKDQLGPQLFDEMLKYLQTQRWADFQPHFPQLKQPSDLADLLGQQTWAPAWNWGIRQCEELFCDFIGLAIFRESFLHAVSYLIAPGLPSVRSYWYPGSKQRATYHATAAGTVGIPLPTNYVNRFEDESFPSEQPLKLLLEVADYGTSQLAATLMREADATVSGSGLKPAAAAEILRIQQSFAQCVPSQQVPDLPSLTNAAWAFYISGMSEWRTMYPDLANSESRLFTLLNDLVLKSIEVFDIEQRTV